MLDGAVEVPHEVKASRPSDEKLGVVLAVPDQRRAHRVRLLVLPHPHQALHLEQLELLGLRGLEEALLHDRRRSRGLALPTRHGTARGYRHKTAEPRQRNSKRRSNLARENGLGGGDGDGWNAYVSWQENLRNFLRTLPLCLSIDRPERPAKESGGWWTTVPADLTGC